MAEPMTNSSPEENTKLARPRFTTLVVDDEHDIANIAGELLTYHDIDVHIAYSAGEALALLKTHTNINAIFSDVMMPGMSGLDLAEMVAESYPSVNIVLTSGFIALSQWRQRTRRFAFVSKPYAIDTVIRLLKS